MQRAADLHPEYGVIGAVTNVTGQPLQQPHGIGLREVPHIAFVCVLIPRRTIDQVGLLDERYCLDYGVEDLDYCEACRRAGLKVGVFDHCYVDHGRLKSSFRGDPSNPSELREKQGALRRQVGVADYVKLRLWWFVNARSNRDLLSRRPVPWDIGTASTALSKNQTQGDVLIASECPTTQ
jgi:hypothetical protein